MEKRKKIFDDNATMVETVEVEKVEEPEIPMRKNAVHIPTTKTVKVEDVFSAFAGYLPTQASFTVGDGKGKCILCGNETSTELRKVCFDCLKKHSKELYNKANEALFSGEDYFDIDL